MKLCIPITLSLLCIFLSACSYIDREPRMGVICRKLKSDIIIGSGTNDTRRSQIAEAQLPLIHRNYEDDDCN